MWQQIATAAGTSTSFIQNQNAAGQVANFRISGSGSTMGNFGVGTSTPRGKFDVAGGGDVYLAGNPQNSGGQSLYLPGHIFLAPYNYDVTNVAPGYSYIQARTSTALANLGIVFRATKAGSLYDALTLNPNGTANFTGSVGVGTSNPQLGLDVVTSGGLSSIGLHNNNAAWDHMYWYHDGSTAFMRAGGAETGLALQVGANTAQGTYGDATQAYRDVMRLLPNGNVGIGTTAPTQKLDVRGNLRLGDDGGSVTGTGNVIAFVGPGVNTDPVGLYRVNTASDASELRVVVGDVADPNDRFSVGRTSGAGEGGIPTGTFTPTFTVRADGNVGVGTTTPTQMLDVAGNARIQGLTTAGLVQTDAAGNLSSASTASFGSSFIQNQNAADQVANFRISGNGFVAGNVGIGTTTPSQKLDVRGNLRLGDDGGNVTGTGNVIEFVGPGGNTDPVGLYRVNTASDASELRVVVGDVADPNDRFSVGRTSSSSVGSIPTGTFTPTFTVLADGKVGIGTTTPASTLDVAGYTRLAGPMAPTGGTVPAVAVAAFTGNLPLSQGHNLVFVELGINATRILSVSVLASFSGDLYPPNHTTEPAYTYSYILKGTTLVLSANANASMVNGQTVKILVTYQP